MKLRKGSAVEVVEWYRREGWPKSYRFGTVTQIGRWHARVLFPIRSFVWVPTDALRVTGFDGDGSSVGWR